MLCSPLWGISDLAALLAQIMCQKTTEAAAKMTGLLTPVLVGSLGLPQSIAVMVGTLLVKKAAKGTSDLICENWKTSLDATVLTSEISEVPPTVPETPAG